MGIKERHSREKDRPQRHPHRRSEFVSRPRATPTYRCERSLNRSEYSPGAIYSYFPSKEDIFFALAEEGLQCLRAHCAARTTLPPPFTPLDQVRAAMWSFYTFSKEQPEYFSLIFVDEAVPRISRDCNVSSSSGKTAVRVSRNMSEVSGRRGVSKFGVCGVAVPGSEHGRIRRVGLPG